VKSTVLSSLVVVLSVAVSVGIAEGVLRVKNSSMQNYDIEMWRYAKELKRPSDDPVLGHEHIPAARATLQSTDIRINEWGLRGGPVETDRGARRRILFLGSSVTLGWGVAEEETMTARLDAMFRAAGEEVEVLNAGIGNYNTVRYVERFLTRLAPLAPTDIVVHYFVNDAEALEAGGGNALLRHSELAVTLWIVAQRFLGAAGQATLEEHYRAVYQPDAPGFVAMKAALARLAAHARAQGVRLYLAMTPDVHDLVDYPFEAIHAEMATIARDLGYTYVDLLPAMRNLTPQELWSMPGDPHPNARGHRLMAEALFPVLSRAAGPPAAALPAPSRPGG